MQSRAALNAALAIHTMRDVLMQPLFRLKIISSYDDPRADVCDVCGSTSWFYAIF
jgi:hypothetical protein